MSTLLSRATALALALASAAVAQSPTPATLIRGARVFDGERLLGVRDVLVRDGRIAEVAARIVAPANAAVVDAAGKTLIPGLIDAHTHTWGTALQQALAFGVTTELDMFTNAALAATWRAEQGTGKADGRADIFSAGTLVTAPKGHGTEYGMPIPTITTPDSAQSFVDARIAEGSDYIKIVYDDGKVFGFSLPTLDKPTMRAVIAAAHKRAKLAVVHIGTEEGARDAIESGADGLVHTFVDRDTTPDFGRFVARHNAFVIPTLTVNMSVTGVGGGEALTKDTRIDSLLTQADVAMLKQGFPPRPNAGTVSYANAEHSVRQLRAAGVPILAGTDAPNPGTAHGSALHRELELLVQAGLTPSEALAAATSVPAKAFRLADRGRIAVGSRADLLLVNGDPTSDITATRAIARVWKGGVAYDRTAYAKSAAATRGAVAAMVPPGSASGDISDFERGTGSKFGGGWMVSTDAMAGGKSTGDIRVVDGGANGTTKALSITGEIVGPLPYAWSGAAFTPGTIPMMAVDLSAKKEIRFWAKGDGATYNVMVFVQSKGYTPLVQTFVARGAWEEFVFPLSTFPTDGKDIQMILIAAGPQPGKFSLFVDEIRMR